ncbi:hypothetical protein K5K93_11450 [Stenotrophomonas sp. DR822]|nr:hypothetical protein [Stenotrophomonas sp. DR822]QZN79242.1 hypothetical protein K5K93_11450 [Stenotrophomonas sp. DR822]
MNSGLEHLEKFRPDSLPETKNLQKICKTPGFIPVPGFTTFERIAVLG